MSDTKNNDGTGLGLDGLAPFGLPGIPYILKQQDQGIAVELYKGNSSMLFSEFVASNTVAALTELNKQLGEKLQAKGIKSQGTIIILPGKPEDLRKMTPDEFLKTLESTGCIRTNEQGPHPTLQGDPSAGVFFIRNAHLAMAVPLKNSVTPEVKETLQEPMVKNGRPKPPSPM